MKKHLFLALEGLSGVGKSTLGKALAKKTGAVYFQTPMDEFSGIRRVADTSSVATRFFYYLASVCHASDHIKALLEHSTVIVDRYISSTRSFHLAAGLDSGLVELATKVDIVLPDMQFLITAPLSVRQKRMKGRGDPSLSDLWEARLKFDDVVLGYLKSSCDYNVENMGSVEGAVCYIESIIQQRKEQE